jgi:type IV secretory pathway TraG/TraD family ATPase VirD4
VSSILQRSPIQGKKRQKNIWVILDELPALGQIPSLKTALSESRKYGGCIVATIQNIWQMKNTYNQMGGMDLLDQFNTRALFRVGDQQTAEYMSRMLGTEEIRENQESLSYGANTMRDGVNINNIERSRPLVLPSELMGLDTFEFFLKMGGSIPAARIKNKLFKAKTIAKAFTPKTLVPVALTEKEKT